MKAAVATLLLVVGASLWLLSTTGKATNADSAKETTVSKQVQPIAADLSGPGQDDQVKMGERQGAGNIELEFKPNYAGVRLNGNGYIEVFGNVDQIRRYPAEIRLYKQPANAPTIKLNGQSGTITVANVQSGDLIFQKDGAALWRMYEDENGLYVESLKTGKHYQFTLKPVER